MKNSFFLVIPKQQANPQRLKEFEPTALQSWLDSLPAGNPRLTTRLLHDFVRTFNSIKMPFQLRLDTLETLRPIFFTIEDYLRGRLIKLGFPKEDNDAKILNTLVSIEREFTIGYWTVLKELTQSNVGWFQGKNTALALQRCIKGLSSIIISHFIMGMPIPDWVWLDIHSLYQLSIKIKKDTIKVENNTGHSSKPSSPEECYFQILLLGLADPTGLMQKEILSVYNFIETVASLVSFKSTPVLKQAVQCMVLIDEDSAPFFQIEEASKTDSTLRYLDFTKLYQAFEQKKSWVEGADARFSSLFTRSNTEQKPSLELLDYLKQRWSGVSLQGAPLFSDRLDRYIAIGFEATYELQTPSPLEGLLDDSDLEFLAQSESERLLSCIFKKPDVMSVGSLVSYRKTDSPRRQRSLGIVDKVVVVKPAGKILFGMQLLTEKSLSISYLQLDVNNTETPKKALFYTISVEQENKSYIIIDTFILKENDVIKLFVGNAEFLVALLNRKNIGLGYWQFECFRLPEKEVVEAFKHNDDDEDDNDTNYNFV